VYGIREGNELMDPRVNEMYPGDDGKVPVKERRLLGERKGSNGCTSG
jgi:hypothetical protein